jgi:hypothetical protein
VPQEAEPRQGGNALAKGWDNSAMNTPKPITPRQRLQTLLAIPERDRTDAEWDEINELEISLASTPRPPAPERGHRPNIPVQGRPPKPGGGGGGGQGGKRFKRSHKRPPKRDPS